MARDKDKNKVEVEAPAEDKVEVPAEVEAEAEEAAKKSKKGKKGTLRVSAVIRPMHSPVDKVMIPDEGSVLIAKSSWATAQIERGLLEVVR